MIKTMSLLFNNRQFKRIAVMGARSIIQKPGWVNTLKLRNDQSLYQFYNFNLSIMNLNYAKFGLNHNWAIRKSNLITVCNIIFYIHLLLVLWKLTPSVKSALSQISSLIIVPISLSLRQQPDLVLCLPQVLSPILLSTSLWRSPVHVWWVQRWS